MQIFRKEKLVWVKTLGDEYVIRKNYFVPRSNHLLVQVIEMIKYREVGYLCFNFQ